MCVYMDIYNYIYFIMFHVIYMEIGNIYFPNI